MTDYSNDIKRYLNGEMTPLEKHQLEKKALSDPFLADALEGAALISSKDAVSDIQFLENSIRTKAGQSISPDDQKQKRRTISIYFHWAGRIAAGLLVLILLTYLILTQLPEPIQTQQLALKESPDVQTATGKAADSITPITTSPSPVVKRSGEKAAKEKKSVPSVVEAEETKNETGYTEPEKVVTDEIAEAQPVTEAISPAHAKEATEDVSAKKDSPPAQSAVALKSNDDKKELAGEISRQKVSSRKAAAPAGNFADKTITGKITSAEDGSPLPGVNVVIKGSTVGTVTDVNGNYQLQTTNANPTLQLSFIGLQSSEVAVGDRQEVNVAMTADVSQLSEVVVTAWGVSRDEKSDDAPPTFELARPTSGSMAYKEYLEKNVQYTAEAIENKVEGRVTVEFTVAPNGTLSDFQIIKGLGFGLDEELIRLIKEGPEWKPTRKNGVAEMDRVKIRLKFTLPKK